MTEVQSTRALSSSLLALGIGACWAAPALSVYRYAAGHMQGPTWFDVDVPLAYLSAGIAVALTALSAARKGRGVGCLGWPLLWGVGGLMVWISEQYEARTAGGAIVGALPIVALIAFGVCVGRIRTAAQDAGEGTDHDDQ